MISLSTALKKILNTYTETENKLLKQQDQLSGSSSHASMAESEKDMSEMTYEEVLQYRLDHAVDENTKKVYEKYLDKLRIKMKILKVGFQI